MTRKIDCRCTACSSTDISYDGVAEWDVEKQEFTLLDTQDGAYCNSDTCMGDECGTAPYDANTGEELGTVPGTFGYILKAESDVAWTAYTAKRKAERAARDRERQQEQINNDNSAALADAYEEMGL